MKLNDVLKTDTVFQLLCTACELDACTSRVAYKVLQTAEGENREIEIEIYTCIIDARNGLNDDYVTYFERVLGMFKGLLKRSQG